MNARALLEVHPFASGVMVLRLRGDSEFGMLASC